MTMRQLDRARPYGAIHPTHNGVAYEQDGLMFDVHGEAIGGVAIAAPGPARRGPGRPRKEQIEAVPLATNPHMAAQLSAQLAEDA